MRYSHPVLRRVLLALAFSAVCCILVAAALGVMLWVLTTWDLLGFFLLSGLYLWSFLAIVTYLRIAEWEREDRERHSRGDSIHIVSGRPDD